MQHAAGALATRPPERPEAGGGAAAGGQQHIDGCASAPPLPPRQRLVQGPQALQATPAHPPSTPAQAAAAGDYSQASNPRIAAQLAAVPAHLRPMVLQQLLTQQHEAQAQAQAPPAASFDQLSLHNQQVVVQRLIGALPAAVQQQFAQLAPLAKLQYIRQLYQQYVQHAQQQQQQQQQQQAAAAQYTAASAAQLARQHQMQQQLSAVYAALPHAMQQQLLQMPPAQQQSALLSILQHMQQQLLLCVTAHLQPPPPPPQQALVPAVQAQPAAPAPLSTAACQGSDGCGGCDAAAMACTCGGCIGGLLSPRNARWIAATAELERDYLADLIQQAEDDGSFGHRGQRQPLGGDALSELELGAPSLRLLPPDVREQQLSKTFLKGFKSAFDTIALLAGSRRLPTPEAIQRSSRGRVVERGGSAGMALEHALRTARALAADAADEDDEAGMPVCATDGAWDAIAQRLLGCSIRWSGYDE